MSLQPAASYTIRLLAPSGYPHDPDAINRALERLSTAQHRIENIEATQRRFQRFGGTDGERAGDLNRLADPERPLALADIANETMIVYPSTPRPSFADQQLSALRDGALVPARFVTGHADGVVRVDAPPGLFDE